MRRTVRRIRRGTEQRREVARRADFMPGEEAVSGEVGRLWRAVRGGSKTREESTIGRVPAEPPRGQRESRHAAFTAGEGGGWTSGPT